VDRLPKVNPAARTVESVTVTVSVPATSANLGPGFDALGLALDLVDTVSARVTEGGFDVRVVGEGAGEVPTGADHLIVATMLTTFAALGAPPPAGLALSCDNRIPHARGLGSSSAAIVAGILLARELADRPDFDEAAVLRLAARLEGHPDNVAPCLLGGFTIAWTDADAAQAVRIATPPSLRPGVFIPEQPGLTAHARAALPPSVPHADAAFNAARSALLVHALTQRPDLLLTATEDRLHQEYRAPGAPDTAVLIARLRAAGVPAVVSGAGPSVLVLAEPTGVPVPPNWCFRSLSVASTGARILGGRHAGGDPVAAGLPS
jgi:homoserine kinase